MPSFDKIITFIPILAIALAATFDVGYFWAIDINFFTLFSLSEHLVFAMQAIPIVLGIMTFSAVIFPIGIWLVSHLKNETVDKSKKAKFERRFKFGFYAYMVFTTIVLIWLRLYLFAALNVLSVIIFIVIELIPAHVLWLLIRYPKEAITSVVIVTSFLFSFATGYQMGGRYLESVEFHPHSLRLKESIVVSGKIIRSGERCILFIDSNKNAVRFVRFENVISIARD